MKLRFLLCCLALGFGLTAQAGITYSSTSGAIPDGNPTGWSATATVTDPMWSIEDVNVTINMSGGYNGDIYAYLSYGGVLVPLLNRVGKGLDSEPQYSFGFSTSGFGSITLDDQATANGSIHSVASPVSGQSYQPDTYFGGNTLSAFKNMNPNGTWTIFFADMSSGETSQLQGWSLDITAVPEPVNVALGIFAGVFAVVALARNRRVWDICRRALAR